MTAPEHYQLAADLLNVRELTFVDGPLEGLTTQGIVDVQPYYYFAEPQPDRSVQIHVYRLVGMDSDYTLAAKYEGVKH